MFAVDEATAEAIRRTFEEGGELSGVAELRRHFPLPECNEHARSCVRSIALWKPIQAPVAYRSRLTLRRRSQRGSKG